MHTVIDTLLMVWGVTALVMVVFLINRNGNLAALIYAFAPCKICRRPGCPVCEALGEAEEPVKLSDDEGSPKA